MKSKYDQGNIDLANQSTSFAKIASQIGRNSQVLDIGCSSGYLAEALILDKAAKVTGIELDPADAKLARQRGLEAVFNDNVEHFNWGKLKAKKFDHIIMADILEHLLDPESVLRKASTVLAPKGTIIASIPNIAHTSIRTELMLGNFVYEPLGILDNTHIKYFTRDTIINLFSGAGLTVTRIESVAYDLPADLIKEQLEQIGLNATPKFDELLDSPEARTYQWVITAALEPSELPIKTTELPKKLVMSHAKLVNELAILRQQEKDNTRSNPETVGRLTKELETARAELVAIQRSRSWHLATFMRKVFRAIVPRGKDEL